MANDEKERHLDVYEDRYELHQDDVMMVYYQGVQNEAAKRRYARINRELAGGCGADVADALCKQEAW